jgi:predicted nucleotidyltransferase
VHKIKKLHVFGSVVNGGFNDGSDIDRLVDISGSAPLSKGELLFPIGNQFEVCFNRKVNLLTYDSLKNCYHIERIN